MTTTLTEVAAKDQIVADIAAETRMQPWEALELVPSSQSAWIWAPFFLYVGIWWKPIPQGANRTKLFR
jgi:hypothetical protein